MITTESLKIQAQATLAAIEYGYTYSAEAQTLRAPPGKFEGEPYCVLYFYEQAMNGCADEPLYDGDEQAADLLEVSDDEREAFGLSADFVALWYSSQGFVSLQELTADEYDALRAKYEAAAEDSETE